MTVTTSSENDPLLQKKINGQGPEYAIVLLPDDTEICQYPFETYGYLLLFCSALAYTTMGLIVRFATGYRGFPVASVAIFLGVQLSLTALVHIIYSTDYKSTLSMSRRDTFLVSLRGFLGAMGMYLIFHSLSILPLGIQTSLYFLNPIFTLVFSAQILGEAFGVREVGAAVLSFAGVVLVSNPTLQINITQLANSNYAIGCFTAVMSGLVVAFAYVTLKLYGAKVHYMCSVLSLGVWTALFGVLMGGATIQPMKEHALGTFLAFLGCIFGVMAQCLLNKGFEYCRAGTGSMLRNVDVPISYLLGIIFLGEIPHLTSLMGSTLVIAGTVLVSAKQFFRK